MSTTGYFVRVLTLVYFFTCLQQTFGQQTTCNQGDLRLVGGTTDLEGRVEICNNNTWGTVCDDYWGTADANVVCRQLGHSDTGATAEPRARFGQGNGSIFLDNVMCNGTELALLRCRANQIGIHNCAHYEDAGVVCQPANATDGTTNINNPPTITHTVTIDVCTKGTNNSGITQTLVTYSSDTDTACIVSISSLAVALVVTIVALVITTSVVLVKNGIKRKVTYHLPQNKNEERNMYVEAVHKEHNEPLSTVSVVDTKTEEINMYVEAVHKENIELLPTVHVEAVHKEHIELLPTVHVEAVHKEHIELLPTVHVEAVHKEHIELLPTVHVEAVHKDIEALPTVSVVGTID